MWGFGYEIKNVSIGVYEYRSYVAGQFNKGGYPAGTDGGYVIAVSIGL
jgi:hypothetical protein